MRTYRQLFQQPPRAGQAGNIALHLGAYVSAKGRISAAQLCKELNDDGHLTPQGLAFNEATTRKALREWRNYRKSKTSSKKPTLAPVDDETLSRAAVLLDGLVSAGATTREALSTIFTRQAANTL